MKHMQAATLRRLWHSVYAAETSCYNSLKNLIRTPQLIAETSRNNEENDTLTQEGINTTGVWSMHGWQIVLF